jgi:hypothetical protein
MKERIRITLDSPPTRTCVWSLIILSLPGALQAQFAGGTGTPEDPYQINDSRQLLLIGADRSSLQKHYVLVNDIDLAPNLPDGKIFRCAPIAVVGEPIWKPSADKQLTPFAGTLDGEGHAIRNLCIESNSGQGLGLFAMLGAYARVSNLRLEGFRITVDESRCVGLLAGVNSGWVTHCHAEGCIVYRGASYEVGGLVGRNSGHLAILRGCTTSCTLDGRNLTVGKSGNLGGLAGTNEGIVSNCVAQGLVSGSRIVGGLIGYNSDLVVDSFATGPVRGGAAVGGLVGWGSGSICSCYSVGQVELNREYLGSPTSIESGAVGGLVGVNEGSVLASFWDMTTSGARVGCAGIGLTSTEMHDVSVYRKAGWDFIGESENGTADFWFQQEGHNYPQLVLLSDSLDRKILSGRGTKEDPYRVGSPEELGSVNHYDLTAAFQLTNDIDLSGCRWLSSPILAFNGILDGRGHVVANYHIKGGASGGLFLLVGRNAKIAMMGVDAFRVEGGAGGLADINFGEIRQCFARGSMISGMAGLVGLNYGTLSDCYSWGNVSGYLTAGGVVGSISSSYGAGICSNLYSTASVAAKGKRMRDGSVLKYVGGLVGQCNQWEKGLVQNSYYLDRPDAGNAGVGEPLTDFAMRQPASFPGWDFEKTWRIEAGKGYPQLQWEKASAN